MLPIRRLNGAIPMKRQWLGCFVILLWICFVDLLILLFVIIVFSFVFEFVQFTCRFCLEWMFCWSSSMHPFNMIIAFSFDYFALPCVLYVRVVQSLGVRLFGVSSAYLPFFTACAAINFLNMILFSYGSSNDIICMHFTSIIHFESSQFVPLQFDWYGQCVFPLRLMKIGNANANAKVTSMPSTKVPANNQIIQFNFGWFVFWLNGSEFSMNDFNIWLYYKMLRLFAIFNAKKWFHSLHIFFIFLTHFPVSHPQKSFASQFFPFKIIMHLLLIKGISFEVEHKLNYVHKWNDNILSAAFYHRVSMRHGHMWRRLLCTSSRLLHNQFYRLQCACSIKTFFLFLFFFFWHR